MKFYGGRRSLARATALLLAAGLFAVVGVGTTGPASASILCRETFAGAPLEIQASNDGQQWFGTSSIQVASARTSATVRVTLDVGHGDVSKLQTFVYPPMWTGLFEPNSKLFQSTTGPMNGIYTFDDAAATSIDGANKPAGLYKPATLLSQLAGQATQGSWTVWVNNNGGPGGQLRAVSLTLTYADCPDANGDGLHDDADGDGVLLPPDNCPDLANADQLDSDVDGLGDACDPTPLLPPPPPVGQPAARDVSLKYARKVHRLKGVVSSPVASCANGTEVVLWKQRLGDDRRLSTVRASAAGKFRSGKVRKPGRYYATVASVLVDMSAFECEAESSRTVKVRR